MRLPHIIGDAGVADEVRRLRDRFRYPDQESEPQIVPLLPALAAAEADLLCTFIRAQAQGLQEVDTTSHVITLPQGICAGNQIVVIFHGTDLGLAAIDVTDWDGFTELTETIVEVVGDNEKSWVAYKAADGTESGTTLTITTDVSITSATSVIVVDAIGVPEASSVAGGLSDTPDPPSATYSEIRYSYLVLAAYSTDGPDAANTTRSTLGLPSGYTHVQTIGSSIGSTDGATIGVAFKTTISATENPGTFEFSEEDDRWAAHTIMVPTVLGGTDTDAIHDNVAGEIAAIAAATPIAADSIVFEDDSDSDNKKSSALSDIDLDQLGSGGATDGHVATADGAGAVAWEAGGGGGLGVIDGSSGAGVKRITSNQAISAATYTPVEFNGEDWDSDSYHDNAVNPSRLTVPTAGKYLVTGAIYYTGIAAVITIMRLYVNGADSRWVYRDDTGGDAGDIIVTFAHVFDLSASDYVEAIVYDSSAFSVLADRTHLQITRLGDSLSIMGDGTELTIAAGVVTATTGYHTIDTQADAGTDDLDTISGGITGQLLILTSAADARDPTLKDGTGNLRLAGDFTLDDTDDTITLIYNGSNWLEVSRSNNA